MDFKRIDKYYYHGLSNYDEDIMISIIKNGILSRKLLDNVESEYIGFNGNNYISVCKRENMDKIDNCYELYVEGSFCIIIDNINASKTKKINDYECKYNSFNNYYSNYNDENSNERYSDLEGEYQVKDFIPNSKFVAIGFPLSALEIDMTNDEIVNKYFKIKNALKENNLDILIVDLDEKVILNDEKFNKNKKTLKKVLI